MWTDYGLCQNKSHDNRGACTTGRAGIHAPSFMGVRGYFCRREQIFKLMELGTMTDEGGLKAPVCAKGPELENFSNNILTNC